MGAAGTNVPVRSFSHRGQGMVEYEMLYTVFRLPSCVIPLPCILMGR